MLSDLVSGKDHAKVNVLFCIRRVQAEARLEGARLFEETKFMGFLGSPPNSPARRVLGTITFTQHLALDNLATPRGDVIGKIHLNEQDCPDPTHAVPLLEASVRAEPETTNRLVEAFGRTKLFGNDILPIWIWADFSDIAGQNAREALKKTIQRSMPVFHCSSQHALDLRGPTPQDDFPVL